MTNNGDVELYYETLGADADPTLLLVNGLGSQCINFAVEWCERFAAHGYRVVRFDNRDAGLSSKFDGREYLLWDMALDATAVLDAVGADRAHVLGVSMGGMVVQCLAISRPERVHSMTSVMSHTGEPEFGRASPEALAVLTAPPPASRDEYAERRVAAIAVYGSKPEWVDDADVRAAAAAAYDRCFCPDGQAAPTAGDPAVGQPRRPVARAASAHARDARESRHARRPERWPPHRGARPRRSLRGDRRYGSRLPAAGVGPLDRGVARARRRDLRKGRSASSARDDSAWRQVSGSRTQSAPYSVSASPGAGRCSVARVGRSATVWSPSSSVARVAATTSASTIRV